MGAPMAGHLVRAGHDVTVYNRTPAKAVEWVTAHGGGSMATPAAAVDGADIVMVCVGNDDDVRAVVLGADGALSAMASGSILIDHTTASAELALELHSMSARSGIAFIDAPVSGGQAGAQNGTLTIMCGGDPEPFREAQPVLSAFARAVTLIGPPGSGQRCKMVNQVAIAGLLQGLSEALDLGLRAGLDMDLVLGVIGQGAAGSWQLDNRGPTMIRDEFEFGFAVEWMRKDLGICIAEGERLGAALTSTRLIDGFYAELAAAGGARWDTSSLIRRLRPPADDPR